MTPLLRLLLPQAIQKCLWAGDYVVWQSKLSPAEVLERLRQVDLHWDPKIEVRTEETGMSIRIYLECFKKRRGAFDAQTDPVFSGLLQPASPEGGSLLKGRFVPTAWTRWICIVMLSVAGLAALVFIWTVIVPLAVGVQIWGGGYILSLMSDHAMREAEIRRCLHQVCQRHGWRVR